MRKKKPQIPKQITQAKQALKTIMQESLRMISSAMIKQIMSRSRRSTPSELLDAIKKVNQPGVMEYKSLLRTGLSVISSDAIKQVRKEIPKAKKVKLSDEFDQLPKKIQDKIASQTNLIVETQLNDLDKSIYFQFLSSYDSTDSQDVLQSDLEEAAEDYIEGASIDSGASIIAAEITNEARNAFYLDDEVKEQIEALQFVNGDPVTNICETLDGVIFDQDDPLADRFQPPFHWNCKTYVIAILVGNLGDEEIESLTDYAGLESEIQFSESKSKVIKLLEEMNYPKDH